MAGPAEEGEVLAEVEAIQAIYGEDCRVLRSFPPHLDVYIRPRTAGDSSQQFVEAVIGILAGAEYPDEPPHVILVESKGLDEKRQEHLIGVLHSKAQELSLCLMLVALLEEAVDCLSNMNHPDGNCPLCLYPLFKEDTSRLPFMKLMSCFHCFHSECILKWWKWLQQQSLSNLHNLSVSVRTSENKSPETHTNVTPRLGNCPVCRMVFHSKDIEHVAHLLKTCAEEDSEGSDSEVSKMEILQSDEENARRKRVEALSELQRENNGLIEPKKDLVVMPGMLLPECPAHSAVSENTIVGRESIVFSVGGTSSASSKPIVSVQNHPGIRRGKVHNAKKHPNPQPSIKQRNALPNRQQWIKKDSGKNQ